MVLTQRMEARASRRGRMAANFAKLPELVRRALSKQPRAAQKRLGPFGFSLKICLTRIYAASEDNRWRHLHERRGVGYGKAAHSSP